MKKFLAIGSGAVIAAVSTHGAVYSGMDLSAALSFWTYQGFFERIVLGMWRAWCRFNGVSALSHADDFGRLLGNAVFFLCPVIGFLAFSLASGTRISRQSWKPLAIAVAFTTPLPQAIHGPLLSFGLNEPLAEAARAAAVFTLMVWSIGAIHTPRSLTPDRVGSTRIASVPYNRG